MYKVTHANLSALDIASSRNFFFQSVKHMRRSADVKSHITCTGNLTKVMEKARKNSSMQMTSRLFHRVEWSMFSIYQVRFYPSKSRLTDNVSWELCRLSISLLKSKTINLRRLLLPYCVISELAWTRANQPYITQHYDVIFHHVTVIFKFSSIFDAFSQHLCLSKVDIVKKKELL